LKSAKKNVPSFFLKSSERTLNKFSFNKRYYFFQDEFIFQLSFLAIQGNLLSNRILFGSVNCHIPMRLHIASPQGIALFCGSLHTCKSPPPQKKRKVSVTTFEHPSIQKRIERGKQEMLGAKDQ